MPGSAFLNFLFLLIARHRTKHLAIFIISILVIFLVGTVMMVTESLRQDMQLTLNDQADVVIQRVRAGKVVDLPADWVYDLAEIEGVTAALPRVFGRYFHEPNGTHFMVVGIDPFDSQAAASLQELVDGLDLREFLAGDNMIVGPAVRRFLTESHYDDKYIFKTPESESVPVRVMDVFTGASGLLSADLMVMNQSLARRVLGVDPGMATDIALVVPNELEWDGVMVKAISQHYDIRVVLKRELGTAYENLFNYQGGVFLLLYAIALATFLLILYQRYSMITGSDRREIGILRAVGWSIRDVITLKMAESLVVAVAAYLAGIILSYVYVFLLDAPLLREVFLGFGNLPQDISLSRTLNPGLLSLLFLLFILPYAATVLIPVWRVAVIEPIEAMK